MAIGPRARAETKAAAMEEKDDGKLAGRRWGSGFVDSEMEIIGFVEKNIFEEDRVVIDDWDVEVDGFGS